jgi:hypothetical protein
MMGREKWPGEEESEEERMSGNSRGVQELVKYDQYGTLPYGNPRE